MLYVRRKYVAAGLRPSRESLEPLRNDSPFLT